MENIKLHQHISFIKSIEKHIGIEPLHDEADRLLIEEIVDQETTNYQGIAEKYASGDLHKLLGRIEHILYQYIHFLLNLDVYHNEMQKSTSHVGICWQGTRKMLYLGFRSGAIKNAELIYETAISCHDYDIAASIASSLSHHYGHMANREDLCDTWYKRYEACSDQNFWVQEARYNYSKLMIAIRANKGFDKTIENIDRALKKLSLYKDSAQSYVYWLCYYQSNAIASEVKGDYKGQLEASRKGYKYFDDLEIDHQDARIVMLSHMIHAYNLLHQYEQASEIQSLIIDFESKNGSMLALRLACTYINLGEIAQALKLLDQIKRHPDVLAKVKLYKSYCLGESLDDGREDRRDMQPAYLICDLYCDLRARKFDRYRHDYLLQYIEDNDLTNSREGYLIEILSLYRYHESDKELYNRIPSLVSRLKKSKLRSTEAEILQFEKIIDELLSS